ncbi:DUF3991 domain-containing protein [Nostoc sp. KVJ3]|nr:DUF3991 domain-containing protein [Nostoc sp. KVJ3]
MELLHSTGLVYADDQQNAVFVMRNLDGQPSGAFCAVHGEKSERRLPPL